MQVCGRWEEPGLGRKGLTAGVVEGVLVSLGITGVAEALLSPTSPSPSSSPSPVRSWEKETAFQCNKVIQAIQLRKVNGIKGTTMSH